MQNNSIKELQMSITVEIPSCIPRCLTPNASRQQHWSTKYRAKIALQRSAFYAAIDARDDCQVQLPLSGSVRFDWIVVVARRSHIKDDDNALAALKYVRDVMQTAHLGDLDRPLPRAGIIGNDRDVVISTVNWLVDKGSAPKIILRISEVKV